MIDERGGKPLYECNIAICQLALQDGYPMGLYLVVCTP